MELLQAASYNTVGASEVDLGNSLSRYRILFSSERPLLQQAPVVVAPQKGDVRQTTSALVLRTYETHVVIRES